MISVLPPKVYPIIKNKNRSIFQGENRMLSNALAIKKEIPEKNENA